jgi:uncharacterized membrane protein YeaQ/YmgE (transglycosylase-associated protein family)
MEFVWLILTGMTAGWVARHFMTANGFGLMGDLLAGVMGALIGGAFFERSDIFAGNGLIGSLIVAAAGAVVFLHGVRMVKKV